MSSSNSVNRQAAIFIAVALASLTIAGTGNMAQMAAADSTCINCTLTISGTGTVILPGGISAPATIQFTGSTDSNGNFAGGSGLISTVINGTPATSSFSADPGSGFANMNAYSIHGSNINGFNLNYILTGPIGSNAPIHFATAQLVGSFRGTATLA